MCQLASREIYEEPKNGERKENITDLFPILSSDILSIHQASSLPERGVLRAVASGTWPSMTFCCWKEKWFGYFRKLTKIEMSAREK